MHYGYAVSNVVLQQEAHIKLQLDLLGTFLPVAVSLLEFRKWNFRAPNPSGVIMFTFV